MTKSTAITTYELNIGEPAPNFTLLTDHQQEIALNDFRGKTVVLYFYPKDSTPGCTIEAEQFTKKLKDFAKYNAVVLGVSRDSVKSHCKFRDNVGIKFPLLADQEETVCHLYGVMKEKNMFGKKVRGINRSTFIIDKTGMIHHIWRNVKVPGHVDEVLNKVKSIS